MESNDPRHSNDELDPGAYIGQEPERQAETIPGGVSARDERVAAYASRAGVPGEPEDVDRSPLQGE